MRFCTFACMQIKTHYMSDMFARLTVCTHVSRNHGADFDQM